MKKIKETITALTAGDSQGAVRISRKERHPMTDERFRMVIQRLTWSGFAIAGSILVVNIDTPKLLILGVVSIFLGLIFGMD